MRIWKAIFSVLTIIFGSLGLINIVSTDITLPIMFVFMGLTMLTNAKECYDKGAKKDAMIFAGIGQHRVQPVLLLPAQRGKLAQVLTGCRVERFGVAVQLLFAVCQMHQCHQPEHHPLVAGRQVVQHFFGFPALQLHVIRNRGGKIIVGVLAALPVGHIRFYA